jgi:hypothetical protein
LVRKPETVAWPDRKKGLERVISSPSKRCCFWVADGSAVWWDRLRIPDLLQTVFGRVAQQNGDPVSPLGPMIHEFGKKTARPVNRPMSRLLIASGLPVIRPHTTAGTTIASYKPTSRY